jgi:methionyl-tRNA synthetase
MIHPKPSEDDRPVLVLGPNPTPNGGMHLGHIAGPYLAGDVYARYQRARGRQTVFSTGTDPSQTFVVATAARQGGDPQELVDKSTILIQEALAAIGISIDGFGPFDETYRETVLTYFNELHAAGKFKLKTVKLPYLERTGEFIVEGLVEGDCPVCLATCRGGLCETCCHPNNFDELINPHSTIDPTDIPTVRWRSTASSSPNTTSGGRPTGGRTWCRWSGTCCPARWPTCRSRTRCRGAWRHRSRRRPARSSTPGWS